jgi:hypothetical protein
MKSAKNDVTGDSIKTKTGNHNAYADGWDRIFKKGKAKKGSELTVCVAKRGVGKSTFNKNN